jgi:hypothetical protein
VSRHAARLVLAALLLFGCVTRSELSPPPPLAAPAAGPTQLEGPAKLHLRDGGLVVLDAWHAVGDVITGTGRVYGVERDLLRQGDVQIKLEEIALVETSTGHPNPAIIPLALVTGASIAVSVLCLTNPKACFGSCPTFYVPSAKAAGGWALQAEGFSASVARTFEADDVDDLPDALPRDGAVTVAMRNEALETHMVRRVSLLVVRGPQGARVLRRASDGYLAVGRAVPPEACDGPAIDAAACASLAARDGAEVVLESDGKDLASSTSITLRYPAPGRRDVALVLTARNSLMSTYVLYQMMAFLGRGLGDFMASVERGEPHAVTGLMEFTRLAGGVDVAWRQRGGAFQPAGSLGYIGPIARATRGLSFSVDAPGEPVEVKLTFARAHFKLDAALLAPVLAGDLAPVEVAAKVVSARGRDAAQVEASLRGVGPYVITLPGDEIVLRFPVPAGPEGASTGYFLHSRGYYYEWMRDEWLRDEDPARARAYIDDPARALRELAPSYRAVEPSMESVFRASRFARPAP